MVAKYVESGLTRYKADYYSRTFKDVFQSHVPVFSHADFQRKNVLLRDSSTTTKTGSVADVTDRQIVIIDWEFAGWYPRYWEYARAMFACGRWDDDWNYWVDRTLEPFRNEYAWVEMLLRRVTV
jgi:thiamine kinase-like enzyme